MSDPDAFTKGLYARTNLTKQEFEEFHVQMRTYRDKFVVHLDDLNNIPIPRVLPALDSVQYLYEYLLTVENDVDAFQDAPCSAKTEY